jgi:excisionase family DNA binding protein
VTDNQDDPVEKRVISAEAEFQHEADSDLMGDEDDGSDSVAGDKGSVGDELTPNDIFGLDPLDVMTLEELAEYLKVSPAAARRVMKEQNLPGRNIGGEWRFLRDAVANWLRGQEEPAQQQQKAREDYAKPLPKPAPEPEAERFSRPPQRPPYQADQAGGEYRPRQRFPEGGQQYGGNQGGQYGNRGGQPGGGGQYSSGGGGQYSGGGGAGGGQYGGSGGGGQYGGGGGAGGGSYNRPPRRPFRAEEGGGGQGSYSGGPQGGAQSGGTGGYSGGGGAGPRFGGGGYTAGGQSFSGAPKRKNKRQVFDNERGKRLDRRKQDEGTPDAQE